MTQQQPPGGYPPQPGMPGQPDSPTQVNYPVPPAPPGGGYPPQPQPGYQAPPPDLYVPPPAPGAYPPPGSGYPPPPGGYPPPPGPGGVYLPPPPPEDGGHTTRNVIIGIILALILIAILGGIYAATRPQVTLPIVTPQPTPTAAAEPTKTPKPDKTATPEATQPATQAPPTEAPPTDEPATAEPPTQAPPTDATPTDSVPTDSVPTQGPPTFAPGSSFIPGTEDQGVILGVPVVINDEFLPEVALLTQNVADVVKDYSVKATFKNGNTITATADGFISAHAPGTVRVATLFITGTPDATDTVTVAIDTLYDGDPSTPETEAAKLVTFGPPTITIGDFSSTVDVEVTNGSATTLDQISVAVAVFREGVMVGTASGSVSGMATGQTKTASLYVTGDIAETDQLLLTVDSVSIPNP